MTKPLKFLTRDGQERYAVFIRGCGWAIYRPLPDGRFSFACGDAWVRA